MFNENTLTGMLQAHIAQAIINQFGIGQFVRGINMDLFGIWQRTAPKLRGQIFAELSRFFCNRKRLGLTKFHIEDYGNQIFARSLIYADYRS